jgi:hypothetical protein
MLLYSCSGDDGIQNVRTVRQKAQTHRVSIETAKQNALDFVANVKISTRSVSAVPTISNVVVCNGTKTDTRSDLASIDLDSLFYIINFSNNEGFVIASSDDRENPIFAYVEEGTYEELDSLNAGFEAFIDAAAEVEIRDRELEYFEVDNNEEVLGGVGGGSGSSNIIPDKFEVMAPLLVTKWGQLDYNAFNPEGTHYTGCVVTAISQICSFLQ